MITEVKGAAKAPNDNKDPKQIIFYGVPGSGKSFSISETLTSLKIDEANTKRVVFHLDYSNADFVGQILPKMTKNGITYLFTPGPFTQILRSAYQHPENKYALIIEEINRGNSAAIFGELFQLLDRLDKDESKSINSVTYTEGWSSYGVNNDCINAYLLGNYDDDFVTDKKSVCINFNQNTGIRLPSNLSLLATMNTSDQNVFTLDNAFQRRWDMEYISNKYEESKANDKQKAQYNSKIGTTAISWGKFRDAINKEISNPENSFANAEDKQLGLFFIKADNNVIKESDFSNKVLKYLWNDIFKRDKSIFNDDISTFGELLEVFNGADAFTKSFSSDFVSKIAE